MEGSSIKTECTSMVQKYLLPISAARYRPVRRSFRPHLLVGGSVVTRGLDPEEHCVETLDSEAKP